MNHTKNYNINFTDKTIVITKKYAKEANDMASDAYKTLTKLRKDYPDFTIVLKQIKKKEGKRTFRNLTYDAMRLYIESMFGSESEKAKELEERILLSETKDGRYAYVKSWFLENFPNYDTCEIN